MFTAGQNNIINLTRVNIGYISIHSQATRGVSSSACLDDLDSLVFLAQTAYTHTERKIEEL